MSQPRIFDTFDKLLLAIPRNSTSDAYAVLDAFDS